jgi:hypothetical protein
MWPIGRIGRPIGPPIMGPIGPRGAIGGRIGPIGGPSIIGPLGPPIMPSLKGLRRELDMSAAGRDRRYAALSHIWSAAWPHVHPQSEHLRTKLLISCISLYGSRYEREELVRSSRIYWTAIVQCCAAHEHEG